MEMVDFVKGNPWSFRFLHFEFMKKYTPHGEWRMFFFWVLQSLVKDDGNSVKFIAPNSTKCSQVIFFIHFEVGYHVLGGFLQKVWTKNWVFQCGEFFFRFGLLECLEGMDEL